MTTSLAGHSHSNIVPFTPEQLRETLAGSRNPEETLDKLVRAIQLRLRTDVCSVYLLEQNRSHLLLAATVGLRGECVGRVRMALHEGLAGMVAEQLRPIAVEDAARHPRFKYFDEAGEDPYHSYLGVPIVDRGLLQGVLVVQSAEARSFTRDEIELLAATGKQLATVISDCRSLEQFIAPVQKRLWALASNLRWCWDADTTEIFRDLDPVRWHDSGHNPITLLSEFTVENLDRLEDRVRQLSLQSRIDLAYRRLQDYLNPKTSWGDRHVGILRAKPVAYFSAEFGMHESLPIYSGGLGVLSGDHVKSASDLDIPLVGIGLFYNQGYFRQWIDAQGWQREDYLYVNHSRCPLRLATANGAPIVVELPTRTGMISARVWQLAVGRITLYLLDSDIPGNAPEDRQLTARLYGGDTRVRIRQELLLGVGGVKALKQLGITPSVLHLNEGHSAFAALELMRQKMHDEGIDLWESQRRVARQICFTTHTPVPAGHDRFESGLIEEHLGPLREQMGMDLEQLMSFGRVDRHNHGESFCMTVLALKMSRRANAVSSLHGEVSRSMWTCLWPGRGEEEIPIGHITNGVHTPTWLAPQMRDLYNHCFGTEWQQRAGTPEAWEKVDDIADSRTDALTIGFARRFATYKRADLLLRDLDLLASLVNDPQFPIQFVFAGKAHPHDQPGKRILQEIFKVSRLPQFFGKVVFIEDYDINVGRHLVQGVDVWLNNPRKPLEASGTSGEKVVLNGVLNCSVLDGWWAEAYDGRNGFAIGQGETHSDTGRHDGQDAESFYEVLQREVIPLFYDRDKDGLPRGWIARVKRAIRGLGWRFSADRMVMDYVQKCYIPAAGGLSSDMSRL
ncbi:MAG: alpha-glucan phosphorylase [Planctomycetota bacterium]|nr:MAG: alpha-glucan phosphorylase [Planctomycetota bacterium]